MGNGNGNLASQSTEIVNQFKTARHRQRLSSFQTSCSISIAHPIYQTPLPFFFPANIGRHIAPKQSNAFNSSFQYSILEKCQLVTGYHSQLMKLLRCICEIRSTTGKPELSDHLVRSSGSAKTALKSVNSFGLGLGADFSYFMIFCKKICLSLSDTLSLGKFASRRAAPNQDLALICRTTNFFNGSESLSNSLLAA